MKRFAIILLFILLIPESSLWAINKGKPFFRNFSAIEYKGHNRNFDVKCDGDGRVFIANFEGLLIYDGALWRMIHTPGISRVTCLHNSGDGNVWFGGDGFLGNVSMSDSLEVHYIVSDTSKTRSFGEVSGISGTSGKLGFTVSSGESYIWEEGKLSLVQALAQTEINMPEAAGKYEVNSCVQIPDRGLTAIATNGNGVVVFDSNGNELYSLSALDGLCSSNVSNLAYDGKGSLWGITDNGVFVVILSPVYSYYTEKYGLEGQVNTILATGGELLVGTLQGLFRLGDQDSFSRVGNMNVACWQLMELQPGKALAATANGVYMCSNDVRQLTSRHSLSVILDNDRFLSGELDGIYLNTFNGSSTKISNVPNVVKFEKDYTGGIWALSLNRNIYYKALDSDEFERHLSDNMSLLFEYKDKEGTVWKPAYKDLGLTSSFLTERQEKWLKPLHAYSITAMERLGEDIAWIGGSFGLICMDLGRMQTLDTYEPVIKTRYMKLDGNNLKVTVASDKFDPIGTTLYNCRLKNSDVWSSLQEDNEFVFNNLLPGEYQLQFRAVDAFGNVSYSEPLAMSIPYPLYVRWYFLALYLLLIILAIYAFFKWRLHAAKKEQMRLEKVVDERTRELKDAQDKLLRQEREATVGQLTKGLIDRILNPMNYINNFAHLTTGLTKDLKDNLEDDQDNMTEDIFEDSMDIVSMMNTNLEKIEQHGVSTTRILKAMEELLKERSGNVEEALLVPLCQQTVNTFSQYYSKDISSYNIKVELNAEDPDLKAGIVAAQMNKVIGLMLANSIYAVKKKVDKLRNEGGAAAYTPEIKLAVRRSGIAGSIAEISVRDNGIGIEDSIKDKIFDPFFTTKPTAEAPGVGLYLSQMIVQDVGGSISVDSVKDEYTEFTIVLK